MAKRNAIAKTGCDIGQIKLVLTPRQRAISGRRKGIAGRWNPERSIDEGYSPQVTAFTRQKEICNVKNGGLSGTTLQEGED